MKSVVNFLRTIAGRQEHKGAPKPALPSQTISDILRAHLAERSNSPAVWVAPQEYRSFREVFEVVGKIAEVLRSQVESAHARIALATPRGSAGLFGFLAAIEVGTCCPLDARLTCHEFAHALSALEPDVLLATEPDSAGLAAARAAGIPCLGFRLDVSQSDCVVSSWISRKASEGRAARAPLLLGGVEAPAILMRTSGTTADPKLVGLSHANVIAATVAMASVFQVAPEDICLTPMPLHHVHGLIAGALSALAAGSSIHCCESFSPHAFDAALRDFSPTWLTAAPALHLAMCDYYAHKGGRPAIMTLRRFRSSSAPLAPSSVRALEDLFDAPLLETYGLTETASTICSNLLPPEQRKLGSVGVPINAELLILDDGERKAPPGVDGEILLRGAGVIREYLGVQPDDAFWQGWLRTGDIGHVDDDGYLYLVGRKKEVIKRGGHSVFPLEIDNALITYPSVAEAITFSIPHDTLGEDVMAAVVGKPDASIDSGSLREHLSASLSSYKIPTRVLVVEQIPRNTIGKALRREMPKHLASQLVPESRSPSTPMEQVLLAIWHKVLRRDDIGVTDNVFQFGADPLRAKLASGLIDEASSVRMNTKVLYSKPTVGEQAAYCAAQREQQALRISG
jgi:acyl-CoA synthetase (AMP-forming)/AMP-acid ligase II